MSVRDVAVTPSLLHVEAIVGRLAGAAALQEVCRFLRAEFAHYRWVGVYRTEGSDLLLAAWDGERPTEHVRIPIAKGLCGQAVREGRSVVVSDVRSEPAYLACFAETRSEIVVPVRSSERIVGEIDIDGTAVGAFDESDRRFLEKVAPKLSAAIERSAGAPPP